MVLRENLAGRGKYLPSTTRYRKYLPHARKNFPGGVGKTFLKLFSYGKYFPETLKSGRIFPRKYMPEEISGRIFPQVREVLRLSTTWYTIYGMGKIFLPHVGG